MPNDNNPQGVTLLTESGVWMVAMFTETDVGTELRQFLAREVLPLARTSGVIEAALLKAGAEYPKAAAFLAQTQMAKPVLVPTVKVGGEPCN